MTYNLIDTAAAGVPYPLTVINLHWLGQQASSLSDLTYLKDKTGTFSAFIETINCKPVLKRENRKTYRALSERASFASLEEPVSPP